MLICDRFESDRAALWNEDPQEGGTSALAEIPGAQTPGSPQGTGRDRGRGRGRGRGRTPRGGGVVRGEK
jgi:hypothetical protein